MDILKHNNDIITNICRSYRVLDWSEEPESISKLNKDETKYLVHGYCKQNTASLIIPIAIIHLFIKFIDIIFKGGLTNINPYPWKCNGLMCNFVGNKDSYECCVMCAQKRPLKDPKPLINIMQHLQEDYKVEWGKIEIATSPQIRDDKEFNIIPLKQLSKHGLFLNEYKWTWTWKKSSQWIGMKLGIFCKGLTLPCYDRFGLFVSANFGSAGLKRILSGYHSFCFYIKAKHIVQISELTIDDGDNSINSNKYIIHKTGDNDDVNISECSIEFILSNTKIVGKVIKMYGDRKHVQDIEWKEDIPNGSFRAITNKESWHTAPMEYNFQHIEQREINITDLQEYPLNEYIDKK